MSEREAARSGTVLVRPTGFRGQYTTCDLSRPGHGIKCDVVGCERDGVMAIGLGKFFAERDAKWGAKNAVRCERHLTHVGAL